MTPSCESGAKGPRQCRPSFVRSYCGSPVLCQVLLRLPWIGQVDGVERCNVVHDVHGVRCTGGMAHVAGLYGRTARWCVSVECGVGEVIGLVVAFDTGPSGWGQPGIVGTGSVGARLSEGARCRRGASRVAVPVAVGAGADVHRREHLLKIGEAAVRAKNVVGAGRNGWVGRGLAEVVLFAITRPQSREVNVVNQLLEVISTPGVGSTKARRHLRYTLASSMLGSLGHTQDTGDCWCKSPLTCRPNRLGRTGRGRHCMSQRPFAGHRAARGAGTRRRIGRDTRHTRPASPLGDPPPAHSLRTAPRTGRPLRLGCRWWCAPSRPHR